jgi:hypothetical protein
VGPRRPVGRDALDPLRRGRLQPHYWDFFLATGYITGLFYLFAAVLAWSLGGLPASSLTRLRVVTWALPLCFAAIAAVSWLHLFLIPIAFSAAITLSLALSAWLAPPGFRARRGRDRALRPEDGSRRL